MLRGLARMLWVPVVFVLSGALSAFVLVSLGLERITHWASGKTQSADGILDLLELVRQGLGLASGLSIVPALAVVIIGEVARIRSAIYYVIGGGLAVVAIPLLAKAAAAGTIAAPPAAVYQVFATAGFAGGFLYWLLAGRNA